MQKTKGMVRVGQRDGCERVWRSPERLEAKIPRYDAEADGGVCVAATVHMRRLGKGRMERQGKVTIGEYLSISEGP